MAPFGGGILSIFGLLPGKPLQAKSSETELLYEPSMEPTKELSRQKKVCWYKLQGYLLAPKAEFCHEVLDPIPIPRSSLFGQWP